MRGCAVIRGASRVAGRLAGADTPEARLLWRALVPTASVTLGLVADRRGRAAGLGRASAGGDRRRRGAQPADRPDHLSRRARPGEEIGGTASGLVVVSNREPWVHEYAPDGSIVVRPTPGGVSVALDALMRERGGVWIAHGAGTADRVVVDDRRSIDVPPDAPAYRLRRLWLTLDAGRSLLRGILEQRVVAALPSGARQADFQGRGLGGVSGREPPVRRRRRDRSAAGRLGVPERLSPGAGRGLRPRAAAAAAHGACSGTSPGRTSIACASVRGGRRSCTDCWRTTCWRFSCRAISGTSSTAVTDELGVSVSGETVYLGDPRRARASRFRSAPTSIASPRSSPTRAARRDAAAVDGAGSRQTRSSASASIGSTTPRAFRSGSRPSSALLDEQPGAGVAVRVRPDRRAVAQRRARVRGNHGGDRGADRRASTSSTAAAPPTDPIRYLHADVPAAGARRALSPRALLHRLVAARRHEPGREGIRRRARRSRRRADSERAGRRRAGAARGADHQSVRRARLHRRRSRAPSSMPAWERRRRMQALRRRVAGRDVLAWASDILDRLERRKGQGFLSG